MCVCVCFCNVVWWYVALLRICVAFFNSVIQAFIHFLVDSFFVCVRYFDLVRNMIQMHPRGDSIPFYSFIEILVTKFDCCYGWWWWHSLIFGMFQFYAFGSHSNHSHSQRHVRISIHKITYSVWQKWMKCHCVMNMVSSANAYRFVLLLCVCSVHVCVRGRFLFVS